MICYFENGQNVFYVDGAVHTELAPKDSVITRPTCTGDGYTTHVCAVCGITYVTDEVPALGHDWKGTGCIRCDAARKNPFADVPEGIWYLVPVLWAVENGITSGTDATLFSPDAVCTRAQVVTFLYAAMA